ncbi:MAG: cytochrome c oxidase cbb3-type subunit [Thermoanaerobaculia bacterium]|nr:cytochrome c oxidase cbb3-type subunit [Thermoanaerobaculia bacterium]
MKRTLAFCAVLLAASLIIAASKPRPRFDPNLPVLGTKFHSLPAGKGKSLVEGSCFPCHSADMLVQQRLNEKQWTAAVDKMIRWGAVVKESDKTVMVAYLAKHFGAENKFRPIVTRPVGY